MSQICHSKIATVPFKGTELPRVCLGTAQLGMPYGIANQTGQSSFEEACLMVELALKSGICLFDTAQAYGDSEEVLGKIFQKINAGPSLKVITKLHPDAEKWEAAEIIQSVKKSSKKLSVSKLFSVMLHREEWLNQWKRYDKACQTLLADGIVETFGVSIYTLKGFEAALQNDKISTIQMPFNLFDQRARTEKCFEKARRAGKLLFIRSIYLQGLLTLNPESLPAHMAFAKPPLQVLQMTLNKTGRDTKETAFRFAYENSDGAILVIGAETVSQMKSNLEFAANTAALPNDMNQKLFALAQNHNEHLINPATWGKAA